MTHNEALQLLDALVQLRVSAFEAETPPLTPSPGEAYALGALPTGAWAGQAGQAGQLAIWQGEGWLFRLELSDTSELEGLMDGEGYRKYLSSQTEDLEGV